MQFGQSPSIAQKADMAKARGYDTGTPSKDKRPNPPLKIKPKGNPLNGKIGLTFTQVLRGGKP